MLFITELFFGAELTESKELDEVTIYLYDSS